MDTHSSSDEIHFSSKDTYTSSDNIYSSSDECRSPSDAARSPWNAAAGLFAEAHGAWDECNSPHKATAAFGKFVDNSFFSGSLTAAVWEEGLSLWQTFLKHANTIPTNSAG
jgi:hypothetical protein